MRNPLRPILNRLAVLCEWLAMALLVAATSLIMLEVIARGLFNTGLPWADELARYSGLGVIFLTVPLLLARDAHVKVDMFFNFLRGAPRRVVGIVNELLILAFCVFFLISCYWFMQRAGRFSTPALSMPNLFYYLPAMAGMVLTTLIALDRVFAVIGGGRGGATMPPSVAAAGMPAVAGLADPTGGPVERDGAATAGARPDAPAAGGSRSC